MTSFRAAAVLALLAASAVPAFAATIHVPADSPTIRSALDAAFDGDTIVVAAGTYAEFLLLDQRSNLTLRAEGVVTLAPKSSAKGAPPVIGLSSCVNVTIDGFTISKAPGTGINVGTSLNSSIRNCTVDGARGYGISIYGGSDVTIADCTVTRSGKGVAGIGVAPDGPSSLRCSVLRCTVEKSGGAGIVLRGLSVLVEDCDVTSSKRAGIEFDRIGGTSGGTLRRCTVTKAGDTGIVVAGSGNTVEANEVIDSRQVGISVVQDDGSTTTGALVRNNTVTKTRKKDGILVAAPQCTVESNTVASTRGDGIRVSDIGSEILANTVTAARGYGVHLLGSGHEVTGNTATGKKADLRDESTGSVLTGNTFVKIR